DVELDGLERPELRMVDLHFELQGPTPSRTPTHDVPGGVPFGPSPWTGAVRVASGPDGHMLVHEPEEASLIGVVEERCLIEDLLPALGHERGRARWGEQVPEVEHVPELVKRREGDLGFLGLAPFRAAKRADGVDEDRASLTGW